MPELRDHTTLRLGGPAARWVTATSEAEVIDAVAAADTAGEPVLVLGGGIQRGGRRRGLPRGRRRGRDHERRRGRRRGTTAEGDASCGGVLVTVAAGENWDDVVAGAVARGWVGIEALSGIPGAVGATPIQNVGAYGQEVSQTVASGPGLGPHACAASAPSPTPTAGSATATPASRPTPAVTSCSR